MQQPYPNYYPQMPSNEYLEQRRISMPVSHYNSGIDQQSFTDTMMNQYRSNSMADAMNFTQITKKSFSGSAIAPPGLSKARPVETKAQSFTQYKFNDKNMMSGMPQNMFSEETAKVTKDFSKMSMGTKPTGKPNKIIAATGELSCHSNSTIKEEESMYYILNVFELITSKPYTLFALKS